MINDPDGKPRNAVVDLDSQDEPDSGGNPRHVLGWAASIVLTIAAGIVIALELISSASAPSATATTPPHSDVAQRASPAPSAIATVFAPPRVLHLSGVVRNEDQPVADARVSVGDACNSQSLGSVKSASDGRYAAEVGAPFCSVRVTITGDGLEPHQELLPATDNDHRDFVLHSLVRIDAGQQVSLSLAPSDQKCDEWRLDTNEWPCRKVHVFSSAGGMLTLRLRWDDPVNQLGLQVFRSSPSREDPPCCETPSVALPVNAGEDVEVQVLFLNLGFRPFGGPTHGTQQFTLVTSLDSR